MTLSKNSNPHTSDIQTPKNAAQECFSRELQAFPGAFWHRYNSVSMAMVHLQIGGKMLLPGWPLVLCQELAPSLAQTNSVITASEMYMITPCYASGLFF